MLVNNLNRYFLQNLMFLSKRLQSTQVSSNHYDILVAGGGMVGTTLACTLGSLLRNLKVITNLNVALFQEKTRNSPTRKFCFLKVAKSPSGGSLKPIATGCPL